MCVYSTMGDFFKDHWIDKLKDLKKNIEQPNTTPMDFTNIFNTVTRQEFEALKKEVENMKKILEVAAKYDKDTGQPNCETEDKVALLKKIAKALGVEL